MTNIPILTLAVLPRRVNVRQAADLLGFAEADFPVLMAKGLLKPLGGATGNAQKYFATSELLTLDEKWLSRATRAVLDYHRARNGRNGEHKAEAA